MASKPLRARRANSIPVHRTTGNIYADLGFENPDEELAKSDLVIRIQEIMTERRLTQLQAATLMGIDQPKVSHILRGKFGGYSIQRLMNSLTALGRDVTIVIEPAPKARRRGRVRVENRPKRKI